MNKLQGSMLCCAVLAISGCQGFPMHFGMQKNVEAAAPDMSSYFAQRLNDGRRHLGADRPGAAVDAFRQASYHPDFAGEAYNGMAIAYDRLGRYDLAERFFTQAVQAAPEDERFARNAARFDTSMLARTRSATPVQYADTDAAPAATELNSNLAAIAEELDAQAGAMPEERLQRVSAREVRIASRDDWASRAHASAPSRPAVMHIGSSTRLADLGPPVQEPQYPVRIALTSVPVARTTISERRLQETPASRFIDEAGAAVRVRVSGNLVPRDRAIYPITLALDTPG